MRNLVWKLFLDYLRLAAIIQMWKMEPKFVVGVTGSAGKTSARDAIYAVLKDNFKVKAARKSLNSDTGIPLDVLGFADSYGKGDLGFFFLKVFLVTPFRLLFSWDKFDVYVVEMGVDKPGDMDYLLSIVWPNVGVFLNALPVHTFNFPDGITGVAQEKGKLVQAARSAVLNADDPNVIKFKKTGLNTKIITFGEKGEIKPFEIKKSGFLVTNDYGYTFAAAVGVGEVLGLSLVQAKENLEKNFVLPPGRMSLFNGIKDSTIIDSTYNSSRVPAVAALKALKTYKGKRKIAVLGDMRELGDMAHKEHEVVAREALLDADLVFTFGPLTEEYFPEDKKIRKFRKMGELIGAVGTEIKPGDVILVKGSQNTIMLETLVEAILANKGDVSKLARRGEFWEKKRRALL